MGPCLENYSFFIDFSLRRGYIIRPFYDWRLLLGIFDGSGS